MGIPLMGIWQAQSKGCFAYPIGVMRSNLQSSLPQVAVGQAVHLDVTPEDLLPVSTVNVPRDIRYIIPLQL